ncbi:sodium hydrogen exchanger 8 [Chrysochromulina tobinii]|uniref:Sodium hydrogen exchanger 8 n=1 Tax=Chrysochromulina tobinii TaxID=1460289 RepID=A0A0M0JII7_9EUKA|nr:sodium hydrogen exchanger 8 [Chrysochromulina tobinii]|eukprot:KOO26421.1 sodium hydrogen exchanger 8 [Chrysochromulina sp. CCMP291]
MRAAVRRIMTAELGSPEEYAHQYIAFDMMLLSYLLMLLVVMAALFEKHHLPASSGAIIIGAIIGAFFRLARVRDSDMLMHASFITFDEELFLYMLLPPIIFEAGFSLSKRHFFGNLETILLFAVVGTLASTFVIGQTIYAVGGAGAFVSEDGFVDALDFSTPLDSYLFGALISATDPVATLSIMGAVNVDPVIYILIFGESVLNDAVAIVLVRILQSMGELGFEEPSAYLSGVGQFFGVSLGSLGVGVLVSATSALLLKRIDLTHHPSFELSLILLIGYAAYTSAEAAGCSGILALFTTGVLAGHYHLHSLSQSARDATGVTLKAAAHLAETAVFAYMGVDIFSYTGAGIDAFTKAHFGLGGNASGGAPTGGAPPRGHVPVSLDGVAALEYDWETLDPQAMPKVGQFVVLALVVTLLARAVVMLPLCYLANCWRGSSRQLSGRMSAMMVFAGLRGAIAFALAHNIQSDHQGSIAAATTTIVLFTTFVLGGATRRVLKCLRMEASVVTSVEQLEAERRDEHQPSEAATWTDPDGPSDAQDGAWDVADGEAGVAAGHVSQSFELTAGQEARMERGLPGQRSRVNVHVFGKVDIGFGILEDFAHATEDGFHGGAAMPVQTRSADIRGPTKENPTSITHTNVNNVHPEDWAMVDNCIDWLHSHDPSKENWLMHCSLNIPHPPFQTNATWLQYVNDSAVGVPASFVNVSTMHAADAYAATSKNVDGHFSDTQIITTRRVYAAMCAETDYLFGRVLDAAEATGHLGAHTYILFNSDHGEMAMEHRQIWKNSMYYHSNMINTGTFMLRTADGYKYIAFGTSSLGLEKDSDYPPQLFNVEHDPDELDDLAAGGKAVEQVAKLDAILMSAVDYPAVDAVAKSVDHWLFDQWFVLAGHDQGGIEATWRNAYSTGRNFTNPEWEVEWGKAQRWMGLRLPRVRRLARRPIS